MAASTTKFEKGVINKDELNNLGSASYYFQGFLYPFTSISGSPAKDRTFNNPKEDPNDAAVLMHLKSGDNSKAASMEDHLFDNLGLTMEAVSTCI